MSMMLNRPPSGGQVKSWRLFSPPTGMLPSAGGTSKNTTKVSVGNRHTEPSTSNKFLKYPHEAFSIVSCGYFLRRKGRFHRFSNVRPDLRTLHTLTHERVYVNHFLYRCPVAYDRTYSASKSATFRSAHCFRSRITTRGVCITLH